MSVYILAVLLSVFTAAALAFVGVLWHMKRNQAPVYLMSDEELVEYHETVDRR